MNSKLIGIPKNTAWPCQVDGKLDISVEVGDVGDDDISSINFGELDTDDGMLLIEVNDHVIRDARLTRNDLYVSKMVRVSIDGSTDYGVAQGTPPTYMIVKIEQEDSQVDS